MTRRHSGREPSSDEFRDRFALEYALVEAVEHAYLTARREVFDVQHGDAMDLTPRQQEVLAKLQHAEEELRRFRTARRIGAF
jgi:hypothetical protein